MNTWGDSWGGTWASSWGATLSQPHGEIVRRGKTKLWPNWRDELKEEQKQREALDLSKAQLDALLAEQAALTKALSTKVSRAEKQLDRIRLLADASRVRKQLAVLRKEINQQERAILASTDRIRRLQEEEDILLIIGELYG